MTIARPGVLVVVTGTGTGVGKTWTVARAAALLRTAGGAAAARKPVQSFEPGEGPTDADVLATATGDAPDVVCPRHRWLEMPQAPPMAAAALGRPSFTIGHLVAELSWPCGVDVGFVEGAGGPRSPLADDGDTVALADALAPDLVVVVAEAGLGVINAVRLCVEALDGHTVVVCLNRYDAGDPLHAANRQWLCERDGLDVVVGAEELAARLAAVTAAPQPVADVAARAPRPEPRGRGKGETVRHR